MASDHQALWAQLQATFEQDIPVTEELLKVLEAERQALEQRDYDAFRTTLIDKQSLLAALELQAKTRQQLLSAAGFSDEPSTLNAAEEQAPPVARAWRKLAQQWQQCQELNDINERIAKRTRLVVGQMLDMLRGTSGATRLYDNKGGTSTTGKGNTITNA